MRSCLKSKDLEEGRRRSNSIDLESFCRVLPLLVETRGRLLPPLEMISSSRKAPPWLAKEVLHSSNLSQIRVATFLIRELVIFDLMYKPLYKDMTPNPNPTWGRPLGAVLGGLGLSKTVPHVS